MRYYAFGIIVILLMSISMYSASAQNNIDVKSKEEPKVSVSLKQKKQLTLLVVKNSGDESIYSVKIKISNDVIKFVKARGWDRDRVDQNTVVVATTDRPLLPNEYFIIILIHNNTHASIEWSAFNEDMMQISNGRESLNVKTRSDFENFVATTHETLSNYTLEKAAELQKKVCNPYVISFDLSSVTEDGLMEDDKERWFPQKIIFAYLEPKSTVMRMACHLGPAGFTYRVFYLVDDEPVLINGDTGSLFQIRTLEQALEYVVYFYSPFGITSGYEQAIKNYKCEEKFPPPVKEATVTESEGFFVVELNALDINSGVLFYQQFKILKDSRINSSEVIVFGSCRIVV